jgi:tetratricopeptide (TPR) repeat protein
LALCFPYPQDAPTSIKQSRQTEDRNNPAIPLFQLRGEQMKKHHIFLWVILLITLMPIPMRATQPNGLPSENKSMESTKSTVAIIDLVPGEDISNKMVVNLSDYLRIQLLHTQMFTVVTRENLEDVLKEQKLQMSGLTKEDLIKVGQLLGAQKIFTGSIGKVGTSYLINLKMIDVSSGEILKAETEKNTGNEEEALLNSINTIVNKIIMSKEEQRENNLGRISNKSTADLKADVDTYTKAIKLNPDSAEAYNNLGKTYHGLCKYHEAMDNYTRAIKINPEYVEAYANRAFAYVNLETESKAIDDCNKAIKLDPNYVEAYAIRGFAYFNSGQNQKAMDDFNRAIALNPEYAYAYCGRGAAYLKLGKIQEGIYDFDRAITLDSKLALAYYGRGFARAASRTYLTAACGDLYQAGVLFFKQREKTRGMMCIDTIKQIDPSSPLIKKLMDKIYEE